MTHKNECLKGIFFPVPYFIQWSISLMSHFKSIIFAQLDQCFEFFIVNPESFWPQSWAILNWRKSGLFQITFDWISFSNNLIDVISQRASIIFREQAFNTFHEIHARSGSRSHNFLYKYCRYLADFPYEFPNYWTMVWVKKNVPLI